MRVNKSTLLKTLGSWYSDCARNNILHGHWIKVYVASWMTVPQIHKSCHAGSFVTMYLMDRSTVMLSHLCFGVKDK